MKRAITIFIVSCFTIIFCCIAGFSCNPGKCCAPPMPSSYLGAVRNDTAWSIFNMPARITQDTLTIADTSVDPVRSEIIAFKIKFKGVNNYALAAGDVTYAYAPGPGNSALNYTLDPDFGNTFNVTTYDAANRFISGTFQIKFNKDPANKDGRYPSSVTFLNGGFRIHLSK